MKKILRRSTLIYIVALAFIGGLGYLAFELVTGADDWVDQAYNAHIAGDGGLAQAGAIYDRNGTALAQTVDGKRVYNESESVRKSLLHVVGDDSLNISTAVQSMYRSQLIGYNLVFGLNMPESLRASHDIKLTVDSATCAAAYDVLAAYNKKGACVIYNYKTGEVICSISTIAYDPQAPPEITEDNESEYEGVYLDNVLSSTFTPGSIFKIVTSAAAIENIPDLYDRTWVCNGSENIGGSEVTCTETHGTLTPKGSYDVSNANENQLGWSGVGQYNDKVNPMQMAIICGAIANGGKATNPTLIKDESILSALGINYKSSGQELFSSDTATKLDDVMRYTVSDYYGDNLFGGLTVCAKTGTGEVGDDKNPNGWMVGYSKDEDCPLAFACVVQDSGFGFQYAGPVVEAAMIQAAKSLGASAVQ